MSFKADNIIQRRPTCGMKNCNNPAMILIGNRFVCGECAMKIQKAQNKMLFEKIYSEVEDGNS